MQATSLQQVRQIVIHAYQAKRPIFLQGSPGIGKSDTVKAAAEILERSIPAEEKEKGAGFTLLDFRLAQMDPADLRGIPFPGPDNRTHWSPPDILPKEGYGILFLDEFNLAAPSVQNASYELILDRRLGSYNLPDGFLCVAAGNKKGEGAISEIRPALRNRFIWVEVPVPDISEWQAWAMDHDIHPQVMGFLQYKSGTCLYNYERRVEAMAFCSPRTWEFSSQLLWTVTDRDSGEITDYDMAGALVESAVGPMGAEFIAFAKLQKEVKLDQFWADPEKTAIPKDLQMRYALITAVGNRVKTMKKIETKPWVILAKRLMEESVEMAVLGLRIGKTKQTVTALAKDPIWKGSLGNELTKYLV